MNFWPFFLLPLLVSLSHRPATAGEADLSWPQFRGPGGAGIGQSDFPTHFGPDTNLVWKTALPSGHSSPSIWADRIFLTGFDQAKLQTLCLDRRTGEILWTRELEPGQIERGARLGNPATATPVTDGTHVFVYFGSFGLACYDFSGNEIWLKPLPVPITQHGAGTSPVLAGHLLLLNVDQDVDSYFLAVHAQTGETVWKTGRPGFRRGFSTPLLWPPEAPELAVLPGSLRLVAYDLATGSERWSASGLPNEMVSSPVPGAGLIFAAGWTHGSGVPSLPTFDSLLELGDANQDGKLTRDEAPPGPAKQHFLYIDADKDGFITREEWDTITALFENSRNALIAVRPGGHGDVTDSHIAWTHTRGLPYVPSPLYYDHRLYLVRNGGLASCFNAATGEPLFQEERLGAIGDYYSSPIAAAGKVLMASRSGVIVVLRAGDTLDVLARNNLNEEILATPAILDHTLYVRTLEHLYAFGHRQARNPD